MMQKIKSGIVLEDTYEIIEEIGAGGGGIIFKAFHLRLKTDVVIKKIRDEIRDKINLRKEADILKNLKHPYLPKVYDFIEREDGVYTVMEYIRGTDMETAVKEHGKFSPKQVRKWAVQLGDVLAYLHGRKVPIIHSDIKPANIMLTESEDICLIDFNISLVIDEKAENAVGISLGFSPPEQYKDHVFYKRISQSRVDSGIKDGGDTTELLIEEKEGQKNTVKESPQFTVFMGQGIDARSDIYSLGVTLYYFLTGVKPPYDFSKIVPLSQTGISVNEGLILIIEKMMELSPDKRYQNGKEFHKAIQNSHKLDRRYISMRRKQRVLAAGAFSSLFFGVLLITVGILTMQKERYNFYYELIQQAESAIDSFNFEEAEKLLSEAKTHWDRDVAVYETEVYLLYMAGRYEECITLGEKYINTSPFTITESSSESIGNIYYLIGNACLEVHDYMNASGYFEFATKYNANNGLYYRDYAIATAKMGNLEKAQEYLEQGIRLGISREAVSMVKGELLFMMGKAEEALTELNWVVSITKDFNVKKRAVLLVADIYKNLGEAVIDREISFLEDNRNDFEEKGSFIILQYLADAYVRKAGTNESVKEECYDKALAMFQEISEKGVLTYQLRENMAILYESIDRFEEAEKLLLELKADYPNRYEVYKRLSYMEADKQQMLDNSNRNYNKMKEYYEMAVERYDSDLSDEEMTILANMMEELKEGGWF